MHKLKEMNAKDYMLNHEEQKYDPFQIHFGNQLQYPSDSLLHFTKFTGGTQPKEYYGLNGGMMQISSTKTRKTTHSIALHIFDTHIDDIPIKPSIDTIDPSAPENKNPLGQQILSYSMHTQPNSLNILPSTSLRPKDEPIQRTQYGISSSNCISLQPLNDILDNKICKEELKNQSLAPLTINISEDTLQFTSFNGPSTYQSLTNKNKPILFEGNMSARNGLNSDDIALSFSTLNEKKGREMEIRQDSSRHNIHSPSIHANTESKDSLLMISDKARFSSPFNQAPVVEADPNDEIEKLEMDSGKDEKVYSSSSNEGVIINRV